MEMSLTFPVENFVRKYWSCPEQEGTALLVERPHLVSVDVIMWYGQRIKSIIAKAITTER